MTNAQTPRPWPAWIVPVGVIALVGILIALVLSLVSPTESGSEESSGPTVVENPSGPDLSAAESRDESDLLTAGPADAPVVLVMFSDYQCPFCALWSENTLPTMMEHAENGDLRIEVRDVNVFGPASERAARASYAAALQGSFWEYHHALFADGKHRTEANLSEEALIALAGEIGLDTEKFATDLNAGATAEVIAKNQDFGLELGATSTPMFVLGGKPIIGAQPTQVFEDAFQAALDSAR